MSRLDAGHRRDEEGILALAVALVISSILFLSGLLVFTMASSNQGDSSVRRMEAQALDAAEGGLNRSYQAIQSATSVSALPCGSGALTETLKSAPASSTYSSTVNYYDSFPVNDSALSCTAVHSGTATPIAAEIISTGTTGIASQAVTQYMEALIKLTLGSTSGSVFDDAVFSNSTMLGAVFPAIDGYSGNDANYYSNGSLVCGLGFTDQGNVTVQGSFSGVAGCNVAGNLTAVGNISTVASTTIGGNATSTGSNCATEGNISLGLLSSVGGSAYAYCSISKGLGSTVAHQTVPNDTTLTNPGTETFPSVPEPVSGSAAAASWSAAGYTRQITDNTCTAGGVYNDISSMSTATTPTVIMTSCALSWGLFSTISLNTNLAIFSTGGYNMVVGTTWQSASSATHNLFILVPSSVNGVATTCSPGPGITEAAGTSFANTLHVLQYTPCTFTSGALTTGYGQVYGGTVDVLAAFSLHYYPILTVPGATGGGSVTTATTIAVVYERQLSSLSQA